MSAATQTAPSATEPTDATQLDAAGHRRRHRRPVPALSPARAGPQGEGGGSRRQRRRHLVLEPLSRCARRFAVARLPVLVLAGAEQRVEAGASAFPRSPRPSAT